MSRTRMITDAASGFGRELTEQLLDRGERVAATARTPERLNDLAAVHGGGSGPRRWTSHTPLLCERSSIARSPSWGGST
jgi:NAD(P)-dependent dehydrogenase (short-subunit alcohol dehydrogenase family)